MSRSTSFVEGPCRGEQRTDEPISEAVLRLLYAAYEQAQRQQQPARAFPVGDATLLEAGATEELLCRWLDAGLLQQRLHGFFLTNAAAQQLGAGVAVPVLAGMVLVGKDGARLLVPDYDKALRELRYEGQLVKRLRQEAENQELVLLGFQEVGWQRALDDPLPRHPDIDPRARLRETIRRLNLNQLEARIRFSGDGTGCRVIWSPGTVEAKRP